MTNPLAQALADARTRNAKLADYPGPAPADNEAAFLLQCEAAKLTGWRQTGWKIGCTSQMAQKMLRTDSPFPGPVYAERTVEDGGRVSFSGEALRLVEPEVAFTMSRALAPIGRDRTVEEVIGAVASVHLSLELVNRRLPGGLEDGNTWNIADGGCNDAFVLGPANDVLPAGRYASLELTVTKNDEVVSTGVGANALGGPDIALTWLSNYLNAHGLMLNPRDVVTTGVVTGLIYVEAGDEIISTCAELGEVSAIYG
jgi:2-keto-4-pentenoate hydratase